MKYLLVPFNPHEDGVRCGECFETEKDILGDVVCGLFGGVVRRPGQTEKHRVPKCLAAEQKLKRLVEAGSALQDYVLCGDGSIVDIWEPWDAAREALEN